MSKKNRKLEKFKPFNISRKKFDESYNVIFDEFGDAYEKDEGYRPIIIFYDERERKYGYLKGRGRYYTNGVEREIKKGEVIIKKADNNGLFTKSTYVDCSQIFWMDKDELESLVDFTSIININTKAFKEDNIKIIINGIKDCILQNPPYLSILNVYIDKNEQKTKAKSLYLCEEKLIERKIFDLVKNQNKEKKKEINYNDFLSKNDIDNKKSQKRFNDGVKNCFKILNAINNTLEIYEPKINEKFKSQELNKFCSILNINNENEKSNKIENKKHKNENKLERVR